MIQGKRLNTIDGTTLMAHPLRPPNFIVDSLLSQGLHILAGSLKVGKSWLAVTVAKGEPVWGMTVKPGALLYLCLEDSQPRIQNRLFQITEDAPATVHFCTEAALLGHGLEEQLENFLAEHPDTVLVIIDTLQTVRNAHYDNTFANDYRDLSVLKQIADCHRLAILLIHHLRKEPAEDVFNRISGTTAISGAWTPVSLWWRNAEATVGPNCSAWGGTSSTGRWSWSGTVTTSGKWSQTAETHRNCWKIR